MRKKTLSKKLHIYQMTDKVLYKNVVDSKFSEYPWKVPRIMSHHKKMTIVQSDYRMGKVTDSVNIKPFWE
jgi:hypothetical protein